MLHAQDFCCADGLSPSYMLHTVSQQGMPHNVTGKTTQFAGLESYNGANNACFARAILH